MFADVMFNSFAGTGSVEIEGGAITVRPHALTGFASGAFELRSESSRVIGFKTPVTGVSPGYALILSDGARMCVAAPLCSPTRLDALLRSEGIELQIATLPFPWLTRWFLRPVLWGWLKRQDFELAVEAEPFTEITDNPLTDWILEFASNGGCPIADVREVAPSLLSGTGDMVDEAKILDAVRDLVRDGFIELEIPEQPRLADTFTIDDASEDEILRSVAVATEAGVAADSQIGRARASDVLALR